MKVRKRKTKIGKEKIENLRAKGERGRFMG